MISVPLAEQSQEVSPKRILIAFDDSGPSRRALAHAADLTQPGDTVTVANVKTVVRGVLSATGEEGEKNADLFVNVWHAWFQDGWEMFDSTFEEELQQQSNEPNPINEVVPLWREYRKYRKTNNPNVFR